MTLLRWFIIAGALILLFLLALYPLAHAQSNHAQHHPDYRGWVNRDDKGCCDNQDCGDLADAGERTSGGFLEVRVDDEWCPVLPHHYLKRGNVPNAAASHACVIKLGTSRAAGLKTCERLLCYQPKPGI